MWRSPLILTSSGSTGTRAIAACVCIVFLGGSALAQHGKSEKSGFYNFPYKGDTWAGEIVSFDQQARQITLQYTDKKGQTETFTGHVEAGTKATVKDQPDQRVHSLNVGDRIIAYYIAPGQKHMVLGENGKRTEETATENIVFDIEVLPKKHKSK